MKLLLNQIVACWKHTVFFLLLLLTVLATASAQSPDVPSGFIPGGISIFAGGGTNTVLGSAASSFDLASIGPPAAVAVDSQGNVYLAENPLAGGGAIYVIYSGAKPVPPILAAVTTQGRPQVTPVEGALYQVTGVQPETASGPGGTGGPAAQAGFSYIGALALDTAGNLYVADYGAQVVEKIDNSASAGDTNVTIVAGQYGIASSGSIGDGGPATSATLNTPSDVRVDSAGNLYVTDAGDVVVRVVYSGTSAPPVLTAEGMSPSSLHSGDIYTVAGQLGVYCGGAGSCGNDTSATNASFGAPYSTAVDSAGNLYIVDAGASTIRVVYAGGSVPPILNTVLPDNSAPTPGNIYTVAGTEFGNCSAAPCGDGALALNAQFNSPLYGTVDASGNIYVADTYDNTIRKVDYSGYVSVIAGTETPGQTPPLGPTSGAATSVFFNGPANFAFDAQDSNLYVDDGGHDLLWQVQHLKAQTITFDALDPVTYGVEPIKLNATSDSGLPVSYAVTGPGTLSGSNLIVNGQGTIQITATQSGNSAYAPAPPVSVSLTVNPATLTVTANDASKVYGAANPPLSFYYTGFVNNESAATALTGQPVVQTAATTSSNFGQYPITVTQGTLAAKNGNYTFVFVDGTLIVSGSTPQTIKFSPVAGIAYGQATVIQLAATASSALPVQFTVTQGTAARITGSTLTIYSAGTVTITANQQGNDTYAAAPPVSQPLIIGPAPLTVTGPAVSLPVESAINPASFAPATVTGFVGADTAAVVTGNAQYTTTATANSPAGTYPIQVAQGTLAVIPAVAANYVFGNFVPGTLTINAKQQTIQLIQLADTATYGQVLNLQATASSGLPVTFTVSGAPAIFGGVNSTTVSSDSAELFLNGVGTVTLTVTQAGNGEYAAAPPVVQTISVGQAPLDFYPQPAVREAGAPNPTLTYQFNNTPGNSGSLVNGDTDIPSVISGAPIETTTATQSSTPGTYPITMSAGTLSAANYYFVFNTSTLTVLLSGSYSITFTPSNLTIPAGQSRQTTVIVTPQNLYQGTVTLSCGQLPANVTCIFSPSTYTFTGANTVTNTAQPLQGTLTINTVGGQTVVGALSGSPSSTFPASIFLLPGSVAGLLLLLNRRRLARYHNFWSAYVLIMLAAGALGLTSCGGASSASAGYASPGTANIVVNGMGTTVTGSGNVLSTATLNVTVQ
jgi:hypothetical protein